MNNFLISASVAFPAFAAGGISQIVGHPFLNITTRRSVHHSEKFPSTIHAINKTVREEGLSALYKGALLPILTSGLINSITFSIYDHFKGVFHSSTTTSSDPDFDLASVTIAQFKSGCLTGFLSSFIYAPYDLIRTKLMLQYTSNTSGPKREFLALIRTNSVFRILPISFLQQTIPTGFYFAGHDLISNLVSQAEHSHSPGIMQKFLSSFRVQDDFSFITGIVGGIVGGTLYWCTCIPAFSIKTRQSYDPVKYHSITSTAKYIYGKYGIPGFFKGLSPALFRAVPTYGAVFLTYDFLHSIFPKPSES